MREAPDKMKGGNWLDLAERKDAELRDRMSHPSTWPESISSLFWMLKIVSSSVVSDGAEVFTPEPGKCVPTTGGLPRS